MPRKLARMRALLLVGAMGASLFGPASSLAVAQQIAPQGRDCQTVLTCRFTKGGSYRGCISAYTCRVCRPVKAACASAGRATCRELRCSWGA